MWYRLYTTHTFILCTREECMRSNRERTRVCSPMFPDRRHTFQKYSHLRVYVLMCVFICYGGCRLFEAVGRYSIPLRGDGACSHSHTLHFLFYSYCHIQYVTILTYPPDVPRSMIQNSNLFSQRSPFEMPRNDFL